LFFLLLIMGSFACTKKGIPTVATSSMNPPKSQVLKFPVDWVGEWEGNLDIYRGPQKMQSIPMKMTIENKNDSTMYWSTQYLTGDTTSNVVKPYELITKDASKGLYLLDEKNSIAIETFQVADKVLSWYVVQHTMILASYQMVDNNLVFEIIAGQDIPISSTGETQFEGEDIPKVETLPITTIQRAILSRKK